MLSALGCTKYTFDFEHELRPATHRNNTMLLAKLSGNYNKVVLAESEYCFRGHDFMYLPLFGST